MAGRNANGEGTIYKRKDGRYEGAVYLMTTSGKPKRIRVYGKTRQEVHDKLADAKTQVRRGTPIADRSWTLSDYLAYWLDDVVKTNRRRTTYSRYEVTVRRDLTPGLGRHRLNRLTVPIVQRFFNEQLAAGCSVRAVHIMRAVLSAALTRAQREELVVRNVARLAELPTYEPNGITPWSAEEAQRFLQAAATDPLYPAFLLLVLYGLRRGEVLGLRWSDIDAKRGVIHIRQQLQRAKGVLYQAPVKTKAGRRDLPLLTLARGPLGTQYERQRADRDAAADAWLGTGDADELVFTSRSGRPIEPRNFSRSFDQLCARHGLRRVRMHDIRHTAATLLKNLDVPARDAQLILGHADVATTQGIYQHDDMDRRRDSLTRLENLFTNQIESGRCRQKLPSTPTYTRLIVTSTSGRGGGIRTPGPRFWSSTFTSGEDRLASVKRAAQRCTRTWLAGCVAVNYCRQNPCPPPADCNREQPGAEAP